MVYTRGSFLWQAFTSPGQILTRKRNISYQDFDPVTRRALNFGQIIGDDLYITAEGVYTPRPKEKRKNSLLLPVIVDVEIKGGCLHLWNKKISLPIQGRGSFSILYLDDVLRVFKSNTTSGSLSVQMKKEVLDRML